MTEINEHYLSLPRKDGDEMELLGNDIDSFYISHGYLYARVRCPDKEGSDFRYFDTIRFTMADMLRLTTDLHLFVRKSRKHYHLEEVSVISPEY